MRIPSYHIDIKFKKMPTYADFIDAVKIHYYLHLQRAFPTVTRAIAHAEISRDTFYNNRNQLPFKFERLKKQSK